MADTDKAMTIPKDLMDPNYVYIWGHENDRSRVEAQLDGYVDVVTSDESGKAFKGYPLEKPDGRLRLGDAVLMRCKRDVAEARDTARVKKANEWVKLVREEHKAEGARLGIQAYTEDTP
jgi:hypothetical protein